ncbi:MAG: DUF3226 domain-containing protein [Saprospiraceae bacterium]
MVCIFIEGKIDEGFLKAFISHLYIDKEIKEYKIINIGGWTKLKLSANEFVKNSDEGGSNIVIFDADSQDNGGGKKARESEILAKKIELGLEFDLFLFPNNSNDGDIESLLEKIINNKHSCLFDCFQNYLDCIGGYLDRDGNIIYNTNLARKSKIFAYIEALPIDKKNKLDFTHFSNNEYWDLSSEYLNPLKNFLDKHLPIAPMPPEFSI